MKAPQFNLDPKLVNTYYPPSGHQDDPRILPHIVFNDPHAPWLRRPGLSYDWLKEPTDPDPAQSGAPRNMVPWMAVVVFDPEELLVQPTEASTTGLDGITFGGVASYNSQKLPADGAFPMAVGDYLTKIPTYRIYYDAGYSTAAETKELSDLKSSTEMTSIIFPKKKLLQQIFGTEDQLPQVLNAQKVS